MATYYIDKSAAVDGDGTEASPRNVVPSINASDVLFLKGGVNVGSQISVTVDNVTIASYGNGRAIINGASALDYGVYGSAVSGLTVQDLEIYATLKNGILVDNDSAGTTKTNIKILRCKVHDILPGGLLRNTEQQVRIGTGIVVGSGPTTGLAVIDGVLIDGCEIYNCGAHGLDVRWRTLNVRRTNCHVYQCGLQIGSHGISAHPIAATITSGWSVVSGTTYKRTRVSSNDVEQRMWNHTDSTTLTKVSGTTPASGEWSVSAPDIYINIGADVAGKTFLLKRHVHGPFYDQGHVVHDIPDFGASGEGHGIDTDDGSGPCTMVRCKSYNNGGHGFYSYRGESIVRRSCLAMGNVKAGLASLNVATSTDDGNTAVNNAERGIQILGGDTGKARNCLSLQNDVSGAIGSGSGLFVGGTHVGFASTTNAIYGNGAGGTQVVGTGAAATVTADPRLTSDYKPTATSPLLAAGTHLGYRRDIEGKQRQNPPCIGAYDAATLRTPPV